MGVSLVEMLTRLGVLTPADAVLERAYELAEQDEVHEDREKQEPWHTAFHMSSFPAGRQNPCGRMALYEMMEVPTPGEIDPQGRAIMDAGKDAELRQVDKLRRAGFLLEKLDAEGKQIGYVFPNFWLVGSSDATVIMPGWRAPDVWEFKGKDHDKIALLRMGVEQPDPWHIAQLKAYIWGAHLYSPLLWPEYEPVKSGTLIYFSRARPRHTAEFHYELDYDFVREGLMNLAAWRRHFLAGTLPQRPPEWRWTETPCDWCPYKRDVCRPDVRNDVTRLEDSALIAYSRQHVPDYDPAAVRAAVLARWERAEGD